MVGKEFDKIINSEVLQGISMAAISLHSELVYEDKNIAEEIIREKFKELKKTVNVYIDGQLKSILNLKEI